MPRQSKGAMRRKMRDALAAQGVNVSDPLAYIRRYQIDTGPTRVTTVRAGETPDQALARAMMAD